MIDFLLRTLTPPLAAAICGVCIFCLFVRVRHELRRGGRGELFLFLSQLFCVFPFFVYYIAVDAGVVPASYQIVIPRFLTLNMLLQMAFVAVFPILVRFSSAGIKRKLKRSSDEQ